MDEKFAVSNGRAVRLAIPMLRRCAICGMPEIVVARIAPGKYCCQACVEMTKNYKEDKAPQV